MSASSSDALKRLAQVDAVVAGNPHAVGFDIAEVPVAGDVLDHDLVGIELDEAVALAPRLFFRKIHKSLAEAPAVMRGVDRDVVEQQEAVARLQHQEDRKSTRLNS